MHKEIERKFIFRGDLGRVTSGCDKAYIEDYYFNKYTRLRKEEKYYVWEGEYRKHSSSTSIDIKGDGTLERDETSILVPYMNTPTDLAPLLKKWRYFVKYAGHIFEVNEYVDLPLIIVEVELERVDEDVLLPYFCGEEITHMLNYYNYNLWGEINKKYGRADRVSESS